MPIRDGFRNYNAFFNWDEKYKLLNLKKYK